MRVFYCLFLGLLLVACSTTPPVSLATQGPIPLPPDLLPWEPEPYFKDFFDGDAAPYALPNSPNTPIEMLAVYNPGFRIVEEPRTVEAILNRMLKDASNSKYKIQGITLKGVYTTDDVGQESASAMPVCGKIIAHYIIEPNPKLKNQHPIDFEALYTEARDRLIKAGAYLPSGKSQYGIIPKGPQPSRSGNSSTSLSSNSSSSPWVYKVINTTSPSPYPASGVKVAVIDTGVNPMGFVTAINFDANFIDPQGNAKQIITLNDAYDDDPNGIGHGTGVASLIADAGIGIAPGTTIMPLKTCNGMSCDSIAVLRAMCYARPHGATVINMSLGTPLKSPVLEQILKEVTAAGSLVVAGAGNTNARDVLKNVPLFPAAFSDIPGVISVGAIDANGTYADFATYPDKLNYEVEMVALGADLLSELENEHFGGVDPSGVHTYRADGQLEPFEGTSFAAPLVSGTAAAIIANCRSMGLPVDPSGLEQHLKTTGQLLYFGSNQAGESINVRAFLLDVGNALSSCP